MFSKLTKLVTISISLLYIFLISPVALASNLEVYDGTKLLKSCQAVIKVYDSPEEAQEVDMIVGGYCQGFILGILETESFYNESLKFNNYKDIKKVTFYCIPGKTTFDQEIRVLVKYLESHPEQLKLPSIALVFMAFKTYFPCPEFIP